MSQAMLRLDDIRVAYPAAGGERTVVERLSLVLAKGEIGCLLGASGCGKTTVLRAIAGFEPLRAGRIELDGQVLSTPTTTLPPEHRGIGMMFQDYALFPHLDVAGNVGFGLAGRPRAARNARIAEVLALVGLPERAGAYPHELSGGQQQRVALARALAPSPSLLLLDEPFSNLDIDTREHLAAELRAILRRTGTTALLVTHDQAEAFAMADAIGVMHRGRILQWADAQTLYRAPADRFVAGFVGRGCVLPAGALGLPGGGEVLLRPDQLVPDDNGAIRAEVLSRIFRGPQHVLLLRLPGGEVVEVDVSGNAIPAPGTTLALRLVGVPLVALPRREVDAS
ncbi:ABC transporter ATP-binding protein [Luteimonas viscosa]|uniref:ABC transporter ATP-binding protein n=1 Tax=Luteimonas viscosa TaxID=1132694 RepID=A0A5D4XUZ8_9GAMM|nr:ABC transporter ATP-binding protein [Luteimonas viscosa]TYT27301.1 ABC transporter ATP-binding protein [Luteimonas viscosa]